MHFNLLHTTTKVLSNSAGVKVHGYGRMVYILQNQGLYKDF